MSNHEQSTSVTQGKIGGRDILQVSVNAALPHASGWSHLGANRTVAARFLSKPENRRANGMDDYAHGQVKSRIRKHNADSVLYLDMLYY